MLMVSNYKTKDYFINIYKTINYLYHNSGIPLNYLCWKYLPQQYPHLLNVCISVISISMTNAFAVLR